MNFIYVINLTLLLLKLHFGSVMFVNTAMKYYNKLIFQTLLRTAEYNGQLKNYNIKYSVLQISFQVQLLHLTV